MKKFLKSFLRDECGAVTVDWVILTAAVVTLVGSFYGLVETAATDSTAGTAAIIASRTF